MRVLQVLTLGAQLAAAISFTDPAENATLTRGATFDLTWSSVDTDPTAFSVYLVNFVNWPPFYTPLDLSLETSAGAASVRIPCDVDDSYGYQFNAINGTNVYVIYAQTPKFSIAGDSCTDPVTTTATAPTCAAATVTVTVRGNSSFTSGAALAATTLPASATSTFEGACPSTIGWSGNYSQPVTLSSTPHAGRAVATSTSASTEISGTALPSYATSHHWNTTMTIPTITSTGTAAPQATGLSGAEKVKTKSCSKKRQARKRHSDGKGQTKPRPRR
ncbi:hypothetical protein N0V93_007896 [Gnomoniopsis smithogilvyi]|uniref:Yeast cell wall synthesis Kre9/Knh1-like N-terminal domain-containing protein n=1 Tax=Gnomoniopsis smithogilvyi TaxID=1191159 RepID=A0A9W8YL02_9PEZI|nr:hypothetical protein N0V93_007896 [Gnomoniopsis smithogilvyi]